MMLLFKLAFRNLTRNQVRTLLNLFMAICAFSAIVIFKGFSRYMLSSFESSFTKSQFGHLQIAKNDIWSGKWPEKKENALIESDDQISSRLRTLPEVEYVSGRAFSYALLANGDKSVGARIFGYDPTVETQVEKAIRFVEGQGFSGNEKFEILIGAGIQQQLQLKIGQTISIVSQTLDGSMSSIEPEVRGIFKTGLKEYDDSLVYMPLAAVQKILGTSRIEKSIVLLKDKSSLSDLTQKAQLLLKDQPDLIVKNWKEVATFYRQISEFYTIQNLMIEIILAVLVFFGILNTLGMSIYERIGEIGTMRALGDQKSQVLALLVLEGLCLGLLASFLATPIASLIAWALSALNFRVVLPGSSLPNLIQVAPVWIDYLEAAFVICVTCAISSFWPALKAVKLSITDSLRANS